MRYEKGIDLIVTIVRKGWSDRVLEASHDAGAEGGTVLFGRGKGIHEQAKLLGICIEPEKEIVLTLVRNALTDRVIDSIIEATKLEEPGHGICFVVALDRVIGRAHKFKAAEEG